MEDGGGGFGGSDGGGFDSGSSFSSSPVSSSHDSSSSVSDSSASDSSASDSSVSDRSTQSEDGSSYQGSGDDLGMLFDRIQQPDVYTPTVDVNGPASRQRQEGVRRQLRQKGATPRAQEVFGEAYEMTIEESIREYNEALRKDRNRVWLSCGLGLATVVLLVVLVFLAVR